MKAQNKAHLHPNLVFAGKAGAYPSWILKVPNNLGLAPKLVPKYYTNMEVTEISKHSSLLRNGKNYSRKKFYSAGPNG